MALGSYITKDKILEKYSDWDVFSAYIPDLEIGKPILSPIREEKSPSFRIFQGDNELKFKDFGWGSSGDFVNFVMALYDIPYVEALNKIWNDLESGDITPTEKRILPRKRSEIVVTTQRLGPKEKAYLDSFGIKNIKGILNPRQIWYNDKEFFIRRDKYGICLVYEYWYKNLPYYKVYRPFAKGKYKWPLNNVKNHMIDGVIKPRERVIITKSRKDFKVLESFTPDVIGFQSENLAAFIPEIMEEILEKTSKVYIWLDNDRVGRENSDILTKQYNLKQIFTPDIYLPSCNDPAGVRQKHGPEPIKKILKENGFIK